MRAADTNVLVRLLSRDDEAQLALAEAFVAPGAWVSLLVLQEATWVLERAYGLGRKELGVVVDMLLQHRSLALEAPEVVSAALVSFRKTAGMGFSDALVLQVARRAGHLPLGTFDRRLGRADDTQLLR